MRKNRNRGYRKLIVWNDAIEYYTLTCDVFRSFPWELKRIASQQMASADSIHRNIAEGYCRRSIKEYLNLRKAVRYMETINPILQQPSFPTLQHSSTPKLQLSVET